MTKRLLSILLFVATLGACGKGNADGYLYSKDDPKYQFAIRDAKMTYPKYFEALKNSNTEKYFGGRQVFGRDVECVVFENYSSVIVEIDLPMYCFKKGTDTLFAKL